MTTWTQILIERQAYFELFPFILLTVSKIHTVEKSQNKEESITQDYRKDIH